ncbi:MAG: hypothetical protein L0H96_07105 [Humibacillus sp.]|nr:hypothetical protein [Humibacillus sp.]MDN5776662.1 hypothetical protein [Humibacillus sp.]
MASQKFVDLLNEQVGHEFAAHQQYVAIAVHYDELTMPELAALFFRQALEEHDFAADQFMQWFIKEQVEEVSSMRDLLDVVRRNVGDVENIEDFLRARGSGGADPGAQRVAGA